MRRATTLVALLATITCAAQARTPNATAIAANLARLKHNASALADTKDRVEAASQLVSAVKQRGAAVDAAMLKRALDPSLWHNVSKAEVETRARGLVQVKKQDEEETAAWLDALFNKVDPPPRYGVQLLVSSTGGSGRRLAQAVTEDAVCGAVWRLQGLFVACDAVVNGSVATVDVAYATRVLAESLVTKVRSLEALTAAGQPTDGIVQGWAYAIPPGTFLQIIPGTPELRNLIYLYAAVQAGAPPVLQTQSNWCCGSVNVNVFFEGSSATGCEITLVRFYYGYIGQTVWTTSIDPRTRNSVLLGGFENTGDGYAYAVSSCGSTGATTDASRTQYFTYYG